MKNVKESYYVALYPRQNKIFSFWHGICLMPFDIAATGEHETMNMNQSAIFFNVFGAFLIIVYVCITYYITFYMTSTRMVILVSFLIKYGWALLYLQWWMCKWCNMFPNLHWKQTSTFHSYSKWRLTVLIK